MTNQMYHQSLRQTMAENGITHFGWTKLTRPLSMHFYTDWIEKGHHVDMAYLKEHLQKKEDPLLAKPARSAIVLAIPYFPHPWPDANQYKNSVALYARGKDYHHEIPNLLTPILNKLKVDFPGETFQVFTDSAPILERDLAYRAGLGWIGKNTCLIHTKKGSLFFLAEIYTTLELINEASWSSDFCGKCTKCIDACPTQALTGQRELIPNRCISYWTIEAKSLPPESLRPHFRDWLFGCDICQTVCPWNQKPLDGFLNQPKTPELEKIEELRWILTTSRKELARHFQNTPLARAAGWKLQRNAIIVATNQRHKELMSEIEIHRSDSKLTELVEWSLEILRKINATRSTPNI
ncbi:MAG: hypothetical protein RJB66_1565 [Pseudomonadota bacterium]|jgi:epoxyqueuosine reductase